MTLDEETELRRLVHDASQPLTALECRLFLGTMEDSAEGVREALQDSLQQTERLRLRIREMQEYLNTLRGSKERSL